MSLRALSPLEAKKHLEDGAVLVDIREADEHARERIPQAKHVPISRFDPTPIKQARPTAIIFHCRSGNRTLVHESTLAACAECEIYVLEGGIDAWKRAGLEVHVDRAQPIEIMRQVQITAGSLVVLGVALGTWVSPALYGLSAFVGAGLVFAGSTGTCMMARLLARMPWNRRAAA